jgi:hypothetical protein
VRDDDAEGEGDGDGDGDSNEGKDATGCDEEAAGLEGSGAGPDDDGCPDEIGDELGEFDEGEDARGGVEIDDELEDKGGWAAAELDDGLDDTLDDELEDGEGAGAVAELEGLSEEVRTCEDTEELMAFEVDGTVVDDDVAVSNLAPHAAVL